MHCINVTMYSDNIEWSIESILLTNIISHQVCGNIELYLRICLRIVLTISVEFITLLSHLIINIMFYYIYIYIYIYIY